MLELPASAAAWGTPAFAAALRAELEAVPAEALGLQRQVALGGQLADAPVQVTVLASRADGAGVGVADFPQDGEDLDARMRFADHPM